eukprot:6451543-Alexandrium_andersonii.AAC.1
MTPCPRSPWAFPWIASQRVKQWQSSATPSPSAASRWTRPSSQSTPAPVSRWGIRAVEGSHGVAQTPG